MRNSLRSVLVVLMGLFVSSAQAALSVQAQDEINHLLSFVETSGCIYNRNGSEHSPKEAREHIQKKYDYYQDKINSAEQFIEYSATKSMISGKRYQVFCPEQPVQYSQTWLENELVRYRQQGSVGEK